MQWLRIVTPVHRIAGIVAVLLLAQGMFAYQIRHVDPRRDYLSPVPSTTALDAMAFGDRIFLHRLYALSVQSAGDTGGRVVPVRNYDFKRVTGWLAVLHQLDPRSSFAVAMASGYFGLSQNVQDVDPIVRFIMRDVAIDPQKRWRFLYDAIYLARHRLLNDQLALMAARQLASYDVAGQDFGSALTPAFILEDMKDYAGARDVVVYATTHFEHRMSADDKLWTRSYLEFLDKARAGEVPPRKSTWR